MKKILFLDLDGTLLNDEKRITSGNRQALEDALKRGHGVVIATGRPLKSAMDQARALGLDKPGCYVIAFNGAVIYDWQNHAQIFRQTLPLDVVYRVFDLAKQLQLHIQTYDTEHVLVEARGGDAIVRSYCTQMGLDFRVIGDVREDLTEEPAKMLAIEDEKPEKLARLRQRLQETMADEVDCFYSNSRFLEIVKAGMNKGEAVRMLCSLLGVPVADAVAAGDAANDLSMIRAAGTGVAMANGTDDVKAAADYITEKDNNHDGIAEIVSQFLE